MYSACTVPVSACSETNTITITITGLESMFHFPSIFLEKTENTICRVVKVPTYLHALTCTVHVLYMSVHVVKLTQLQLQLQD